MTAWGYLIVAGILEVTWAMAMKWSEGFSKLLPSAVMVVAAVGSLGFLAIALKELPVSTGYPAWMGIGAVGTVIGGMLLFGELMTLTKAISALAIFAGVIGLKLAAV